MTCHFKGCHWLFLLYCWTSSSALLSLHTAVHSSTSMTHLPSCVSLLPAGLACVEATASGGALVCRRWNGCGLQASARQQETGAEEAWLTDCSANTLRVREENEVSCYTTAPPLLLTPPVCSPCISLIPTCCHLRHHRYLPVTVSFAFTLYPSRSLSNTHPFFAPLCLLWFECSSCPLFLSLSLPSLL